MNKFNWNLTLSVFQVITIIFVTANVIPVPQGLSSNVDVKTAKIIKDCYRDDVTAIGLAGSISDWFVTSMSLDDPISVVLLKSDKSGVLNNVVSTSDPYKLQIFGIMATSPLELEETLVWVKNSRWWNHMAQFYILDSHDKRIGCSEAFQFLWVAWRVNLLGAKFICNGDAEGALIYTFNPYTKHAPAPWKIEEIKKGVNNHPWTLFVRKLSGNVSICENIDFDQTRNTGGYEVRLTVPQYSKLSKLYKIRKLTESKVAIEILKAAYQCMNLKFKLASDPPNPSLGFVDKEGKGHGVLKDLTNGRSDILLRITPSALLMQLVGTYPIMNVQFFAVTQYTSYVPPWRQVISAIDYWSRIGICLVIIVTVIFLKFFLHQSFMIAALNTLRMICNSCFTKLPNALGPRLFLGCLFFFVLTVQALYQGQLSALLTKRVRYPNINNAEDLAKSHHVIYGRYNDSVIFSDPAFKNRFVGFNYLSTKCTDYVLKNSSIACVGTADRLIVQTIQSKLHISKHPVAQVFMMIPLRKDFPLEQKFNRYSFYFIESGILGYHQKYYYAKAFRTLDTYENGDSGQTVQILTLEHLGFAFMIFAFGLGCASVSFLLEIFVCKPSRWSRVKGQASLRRRNQSFSSGA